MFGCSPAITIAQPSQAFSQEEIELPNAYRQMQQNMLNGYKITLNFSHAA